MPTLSSSITPYQDPQFGERPTYERRMEDRKRTHEMVAQQDDIMTDAYYDVPTESEEGGGAPLDGIEDEE